MTGLPIDDPATRSKLANWAVKASGLKYTSYARSRRCRRVSGRDRKNSIASWFGRDAGRTSRLTRWIWKAPPVLLPAPTRKRHAANSSRLLLSSPSMRIAGGTDEILRNIIAERVLGLPGDIRVDKDVPFNKIPTKGAIDMADAATKAPKARYATQDRIGVLEELLQERYSVRAFLPQPVPRETNRACPYRGAAHGVMVQQPALAGVDRKRQGQGAVSQGDLCRGSVGRQGRS